MTALFSVALHVDFRYGGSQLAPVSTVDGMKTRLGIGAPVVHSTEHDIVSTLLLGIEHE
jgi:hypothetical protein